MPARCGLIVEARPRGYAPPPRAFIGASGSGKSTTCELFQRRAADFWLLYGIDHFLAGTLPARYGHHGPMAREGIEAVPVDVLDAGGHPVGPGLCPQP